MGVEWPTDPWHAHHLELPPLSILNCFIISITFLLFYYHFHSSRSLVPTCWPVIGMLPTVIVHFNHIHDFMAAAMREVGYTYMFKGPWFFGMDFLVTCDPANVNHVFNTSFANYPKGEEFTEMFDILGDSLFGADGESWRLQRKIAHTLTGSRDIRSFILNATLKKAEKGLVPLLQQFAASGDAVDMESVFSRVTFDITCFMVFGVDPRSLSIEFPTVPFARAIDNFWEVAAFRHAVPRSCWKLMKWMRVGPEKVMAEASEVIDRYIAQQISIKREEKKKKGGSHDGTQSLDLLTFYMDQATEELTSMFPSEDKFLRDSTLFLMIAGRDAFSICLAWMFWLLHKNPEAEAKILDEIRGLRKESSRSVFDAEEVGRMVYLHGAVLETLRLYPPIPFEHKAAVRADVLPSGHKVEAGTRILFSVHAMGRVEESWGSDWAEFRPERWITQEGRTRHEVSYKFMAFNSGPRSCLGKEIALLQVKMVAATAVWNFEVSPVEGLVVEPKVSVMFRMKNGMKVTVRRRI